MNHKYSTYVVVAFITLISMAVITGILTSEDVDDICSQDNMTLYRWNGTWMCGSLQNIEINYTTNNITNLLNYWIRDDANSEVSLFHPDDHITGQIEFHGGNGKIVTTNGQGAMSVHDDSGIAGTIDFAGNTAGIGISADGVSNNYDYDGTFIFRQKASNPDGIVEYLFIEEAGDWRFALPSSGSDYATGNPRSMIIGYGASNNDSDVQCSHNGYDMIDCDTGATGGDLGVTGDIQTLSNLYVGTSGTTLTANSTSGNVGIGINNPETLLDVLGSDGTTSLKVKNYNIVSNPLVDLLATASVSVDTGKAISIKQEGSGWATAMIYSDGKYCMGGGSATRDTCLSRADTNVFKISSDASNGDADLNVTRNVYAGGNITVEERVGIGTSTPTDELNVVGNGNFTGNVELGKNLTFSSIYKLFLDGNNNFVLRDINDIKNVFTIEDNAPINSLYIASDGQINISGKLFSNTGPNKNYLTVDSNLDSILFLEDATQSHHYGIGRDNTDNTLNIEYQTSEGDFGTGTPLMKVNNEGYTEIFGGINVSGGNSTIKGEKVEINVSTSTANSGFTVHSTNPNNFYVNAQTDQVCIGDYDLGCKAGSQKLLIENEGSARTALTFVSKLTSLEAFANSVFDMSFNSNSSDYHPRAVGMQVTTNLLGGVTGDTTDFHAFGGNVRMQIESPYDINITETSGFRAKHSEFGHKGDAIINHGYGFFSSTGTSSSTTGTVNIDNYYHFKADDLLDFTNGDTTNLTGLWLDKQTTGTNNYGIVLNGDGAGSDIVFGDNKDAKIYWDGSNLIFNTNLTTQAEGNGDAWFSKNVSATGYITRTSVFDSSKNARDYIKNSSYYIDSKTGEIDHSKFYGYTTYQVRDESNCSDVYDYTRYTYIESSPTEEKVFTTKTPLSEDILSSFDITLESQEDILKEVCGTKTEEGVMIDHEIDVLRQMVFEMSQELCSMGRLSFC